MDAQVGKILDALATSAIVDFADLAANHMRQDGADVVIEDGAGNRLVLAAVDLATLDAGDFEF